MSFKVIIIVKNNSRWFIKHYVPSIIVQNELLISIFIFEASKQQILMNHFWFLPLSLCCTLTQQTLLVKVQSHFYSLHCCLLVQASKFLTYGSVEHVKIEVRLWSFFARRNVQRCSLSDYLGEVGDWSSSGSVSWIVQDGPHLHVGAVNWDAVIGGKMGSPLSKLSVSSAS